MFDNITFQGNFSFEYPYFLLLIVLFIVCSVFCKAKVQSYYMPHLNIYQSSQTINSTFTFLLKWLTIIFAIIALASPIKELNTINTKKDGIDIVLSLDTSGSMKQIGFNPKRQEQNRWIVVQNIVNDFIQQRVNDNIALVVFGSSVMTASPLSYDKKAQKRIINSLNIGIVGDKTALLDSLATSINILKTRDTKSKVIIAITDGDDTASQIPVQVITKLSKKYDIKIYTIAIGATNPYMLQELSNANYGKFFKAYTKDDLKKVYETINKLEKTKIEQHKIVLKEYYFFYPLLFSFITLLFYIYLKNKRENI